MSNEQRLRVLLADDHAAVRRGLRAVLQPQCEISGEASNGWEAVEQTRALLPDVVLLDFRMPELNGLAAAREILRERPGTRILLLTMQSPDVLTGEAKDAGIEAVVLKSDVEGLTAQLERMARSPVHLAGAAVGRSRHIGAFFASDDERYAILGPHVAEGLSCGQKAFHIVDRALRGGYAERLAQEGVDVESAMRHQRLEVVAWDDIYLAGGRFDPHAMLRLVEDVCARAAVEGFPATRVVGQMEWALNCRLGAGDLFAYETLVNNAFLGRPDVLTCAYDLSKFDERVIADVMRAHSAILVNGALVETSV